MNHKLEHFKKFNQVGQRRKYIPSKKRIEKFHYNNEWESDVNNLVHTYRDYKCCYITVMKNKRGLYEPRINGSSVNDYPDVVELPKEYQTLEEAKASAFMFVDKVTEKNK